MVIILMGAAGDGAAVIAHALAAEVQWPVAEWPDAGALHGIAARVLGRREHLIVVSTPLTPADQHAVRGDLLGLRFVNLADQDGNPERTLRAIRREFGL
ncbi:MAG: hypothetical protein ACRD2I_14740 [Vicinamibacterales bacterium]